jgi:hypothetical protein
MNATEVYLSIINMRPEGSFCVDRNTYILLPDGEKSVATQISGIPACPENYIFSHLNERLKFSLHFSGDLPLSFDLIEDCNDACFSIMGICSDEKLNSEINEAYNNYNAGFKELALEQYMNILVKTSSEKLSLNTGLYINIINILNETRRNEEATIWMKKFEQAKQPYYRQAMDLIRR